MTSFIERKILKLYEESFPILMLIFNTNKFI